MCRLPLLSLLSLLNVVPLALSPPLASRLQPFSAIPVSLSIVMCRLPLLWLLPLLSLLSLLLLLLLLLLLNAVVRSPAVAEC